MSAMIPFFSSCSDDDSVNEWDMSYVSLLPADYLQPTPSFTLKHVEEEGIEGSVEFQFMATTQKAIAQDINVRYSVTCDGIDADKINLSDKNLVIKGGSTASEPITLSITDWKYLESTKEALDYTLKIKITDIESTSSEVANAAYYQEIILKISKTAEKKKEIPEIDLPGHMQAALAAYPELGCTGGPYEVWKMWGVSEDVLCAGNDKTLLFIEDVLSEMVDIFPSEYIHVGGDECPKIRWEKCPKCQARIKELRLKADKNHTAEQKLQSYIINYAEQFLNGKGRRIIGWEEILEGGLAPNATVMSWRGIEGGIEAVKHKHDAIMTPSLFLYFDYYQTMDTDNEPPAIGGYVPLEKVYSYEPVPQTLTSEEAKYIVV